MELWTALTIGALGSLHCAGMCGPIALAVPIVGKGTLAKFFSRVVYNSGRVFSYALMGAFFGSLGYGVAIWSTQQGLSVVLGSLIILSVLIPFGLKRFFNFSILLNGFISKIKQRMGLLFGKKRWDTVFLIGFLNGFLPCGLVYIAIAGSVASGNLLGGSLYMAAFGLGTLPMMLAVSYLTKWFGPNIRLYVRKAMPVIVLFLGVMFIMRGLNLGIPYISPKINHTHSVTICH